MPYKALHESDFANAMEHITGIPELKKAIVMRYGISMPELSSRELLAHGVAITTLRIIGTFV